MPPTFLLVVAFLLLALLAPVVLVGALVCTALPAHRDVGLRALRAGLTGGLGFAGAGALVSLAFGATLGADLLAAFGFGFTVAAVGWPLFGPGGRLRSA